MPRRYILSFDILLFGLAMLPYFASLCLLAYFCARLCQYPDKVQIPLKYWDGHYYVRVRIDGKEGWMVVDTGASRTVLYKHACQSIDYTEHQVVRHIRFPSFDRVISARKITVQAMSVGNWSIPRLNTMILEEELPLPTRLEGLPVFGILGHDLLRQWRVVHFTREALVLSRYRAAIPPSAVVFHMVEVGGIPAIREHMQGTHAPMWLIDTGSKAHYVSAEIIERLTIQLSTYWRRQKSTSPVGIVKLRGACGKTLSVPAIIVPAGRPPFQKPHITRRQGILGNGLLHRYEMVLDTKAQRVWFVPTKVPSKRGTYGLLLSNRQGDETVYVHFLLPQTPSTPETTVRLRAVDGVSVDGWQDWVLKRLLCASVGSRVHLEVELPSGTRQEVVCRAYVPEEVSVREYLADTQRGSLRLRHTVISFGGEWTAPPFDYHTYCGYCFPTPQIVNVREGTTVQVPLRLSITLKQPASEAGARLRSQPDRHTSRSVEPRVSLRSAEYFVCGSN